MYHPFIVGDRIYLRGLERADLEGPYFDWLDDQEVTRYLETGFFPNSREKMEAYYAAVTGSPSNVLLAVCDKATDRSIGNVKLGPIEPVHRHAEFGILIGEKSYWGKGYGSEATRLVVDYGFGRLNLHTIGLGVHADHAGAVRAYEKAGFSVVGRIPQRLYLEGGYRDKILMSVTADEFYARHGRNGEPRRESR